MLERFQGKEGRRLRVEALCAQKIVAGNKMLAEELADQVELHGLTPGEAVIEQGADDNYVYFILAGAVDIVVNGRVVGRRGDKDHFGEMATIQPTQRRSASVVAVEHAVVARLSEPRFAELGAKYPELYRYIAQELARRLLQRNTLINARREKIRVFIISSAEALPIARAVQDAFEHDPFITVVWTDGIFRVAHYTLESLEAEVDNADFAIAIAHADDVIESRGKDWPSPRDNVIFELGLFMGRLGRARAILMEPREEKVKLPSDFSGITTIHYRFEKGADAPALLGPACNALRNHINELGPNNR